eukprot:538060_1
MSAKCYDMYYGQSMSINHLISMMIYCNYDELQKKFSETFRKLGKYETNKSLKRRHRNYYHLAKLLRECVECFGMYCGEILEMDQCISVFHGINKCLTFTSMDTRVQVPFSTTTDYSVANSFCNNEGIILKMFISVQGWCMSHFENIETTQRIKCMDMHWISDFSNEQEIFCIGGISEISLQTIIQVQTGNDYIHYIEGLRTFSPFMETNPDNLELHLSWNGYPSNLNLQMAFRLLSHELHRYAPNHTKAHEFKSCPQYIQRMLHTHCVNVKSLRMNSNQKVMKHVFWNNVPGWIDLDLITAVFPHLQYITFTAIGSNNVMCFTEPLLYEYILEYTKKNKHSSFEEIIIQCDCEYYNKIVKCVEKYKHKFQNCSWSIIVEIDDTKELCPNSSLLKEGIARIADNDKQRNERINEEIKDPGIQEYLRLHGLDERIVKKMILNFGSDKSVKLLIQKFN